MKIPHRLTSLVWLIVLICSGGFLVWVNSGRINRVEYISGLAGPLPSADAASPTGYATGLRRIITPEHNNDSYQWILQTQQLLSKGQWHLRHVEYDNAPLGRELYSPSAYRWWLGLVAMTDQVISGQSPGIAVERAALYADPLLHLLLLVGTVIFAARYFGSLAATLLAVGWVTVYPLTGAFLPGQPNDYGLGLFGAWWSLLPLIAGLKLTAQAESQPPDDAARSRRQGYRMFLLAGIAGGIGLWLSPSRQIPILAGIFVGAILASWLARRTAGTKPAFVVDSTAWQIWSLGGAGSVLACFVIECFPDHMTGLRLETVHPLYGMGWLGAGVLLARITANIQRRPTVWNRREIALVVFSVLAVAAVPVVMALTENQGFLTAETQASRLTNLPESVTAAHFGAWILRDGLTLAVWATCLPLLLLIPAISRLVRGQIDSVDRATVALALGPVAIALVFACLQVRWWNMLDVMLLVLLVALTDVRFTAKFRLSQWRWAGGLAIVVTPALVLLAGQVQSTQGEEVNATEVESLIERDLAHWLANQTGATGVVVLAPPNLTTSLFFHGGMAGLGTPYYENKDGFAAAVRIAGATSPDEAQALARSRGVTHIVIPSWDNFLDEYARLGSGKTEHSLMTLLHNWLPPRWLQPVPYHLPKIPGFESQSVVIFQVVDVQDNATALSHLAEYFIEMGQIELATSLGQALERLFPTDLNALVARALVEQARGNSAGLAQIVNALSPYITRGDDRALPWDRRVSLAIALTEGKKYELAREQVRSCLAEADESLLRSLSTGSLYRLQLMSKGFKLSFTDPRLSGLARNLLPVEYREQL